MLNARAMGPVAFQHPLRWAKWLGNVCTAHRMRTTATRTAPVALPLPHTPGITRPRPSNQNARPTCHSAAWSPDHYGSDATQRHAPRCAIACREFTPRRSTSRLPSSPAMPTRLTSAPQTAGSCRGLAEMVSTVADRFIHQPWPRYMQKMPSEKQSLAEPCYNKSRTAKRCMPPGVACFGHTVGASLCRPVFGQAILSFVPVHDRGQVKPWAAKQGCVLLPGWCAISAPTPFHRPAPGLLRPPLLGSLPDQRAAHALRHARP